MTSKFLGTLVTVLNMFEVNMVIFLATSAWLYRSTCLRKNRGR